MNILLIYPRFPDTFWSFSHALPFIGKKAAFPPLGLITVAALLPKHFKMRLVDMNVTDLNNDNLEWADIAFISAMAVQRKSAAQVIDRCRAKGLKLVAGGPLFTAEPSDFGKVDHLILGEAEASLPPFLKDLENGCLKKIYQAETHPDIRLSPVPLWDLVDTRSYGALNIQYSRGCPFNCEFCNITALFGRKMRIKTSAQVIAELEVIYQSGWRGPIFFVDDNFIGNKKALKENLLPELIKWRQDKKGCVFFTEASINLADDSELMEMMAEAGFDSVFIGIETPDTECLSECSKTHNKNRDMINDVRKIHGYGLQVMAGFIVGFDNDTASIFQRQIDFIQKSGIVTAMVGILQAPPKTRLFERLELEGRVSKVFSGDNVDGQTNIIPEMGMETLVSGYRNIMKQIYSPRKYYQRVRRMLKDLKEPIVRVPADSGQVLSFFRACFRLGVVGKERLHYWLLLAWIMTHKPRLLSLAVTMSIYGYHYRRVCELHIL